MKGHNVFQLHSLTKLATLVGLAAAATIGGTALPAGAADPCTTRTTTAALSQFGDTNQYFASPGGTFESLSWTGSGLSLVSGNEPWKVMGSTHAKSLKLNAGGSATSPTFCVASAEDSTRYFVKRPGVAGARIKIEIRVTSGVNQAINTHEFDGSTAGWALTPKITLPDIRDASGQQWVTLKLMTSGTSASWTIDDVLIDPWRTN